MREPIARPPTSEALADSISGPVVPTAPLAVRRAVDTATHVGSCAIGTASRTGHHAAGTALYIGHHAADADSGVAPFVADMAASVGRRVVRLGTWLSGRLTRRVRPGLDRGMSAAEYAVGTIAACAVAALLFKVVTSGEVQEMLTTLIQNALNTTD